MSEMIKIRLHNNNMTKYVDYEGTIDEIVEKSKEQVKLSGWDDGFSEDITNI